MAVSVFSGGKMGLLDKVVYQIVDYHFLLIKNWVKSWRILKAGQGK
jgi:hypothetical protein